MTLKLHNSIPKDPYTKQLCGHNVQNDENMVIRSCSILNIIVRFVTDNESGLAKGTSDKPDEAMVCKHLRKFFS